MAEECQRAGLNVTSSWLWAEAVDVQDPVAAGNAARRDLSDLREADVFVGFIEPAARSARGRGGRHLELGVALALGKRVVLIGPEHEHIFHWLVEAERYPDWASACEALLSSDG